MRSTYYEPRDNKKQSQNFLVAISDLVTKIGLNDVKQSFNSKAEIVTVSGTKDGIQHTITLAKQLHGIIQTTAQFAANMGRDALIAQAKNLSKQGYKQQQIALMLGVSQATISKYLRK